MENGSVKKQAGVSILGTGHYLGGTKEKRVG